MPAIPDQISSFQQRMLHNKIKTFNELFEMALTEDIRALNWCLEGHSFAISVC